jgi:peptide chain release factor 1
VKDTFLAKLEEVERKYDELAAKLSDPAVSSDRAKYEEAARAYSELGEIVGPGKEYRKVADDLRQAEELLRSESDHELRAMAEQEIAELSRRREELETELTYLLLPSDPNDSKDVIVEIRAGTGGEEAGLFAADLLRMYSRYAETKGWKVDIMNSSPTEIGGYKEVVVEVAGRGAYSELKHESGVHRVQRVPATESSGRIHTSAATVAVLPEASDIEVDIAPDDLRIETFRASGAGGQHVQKNETAVRIIHEPTGIVSACQDERSQLQNREKAMRYLRAQLYEMRLREQRSRIDSERRSQVGSGDRSEKIRTYNFPQNRVTDHRVGLTLHKLDRVMEGEIAELVDALREKEKAERLAAF